MNVVKEKVRWVIQSNLTSQDDLTGLKNGCNNCDLPYTEVQIIPFTDELPYFEIHPCSIYYGSTTFNTLVYNNRLTKDGIFFNPETFSIENYFANWGKYMLNYGASVTSFGKLFEENYEREKLLFIRPDDDSKSFAGEVKRFDEIMSWYEKLNEVENSNLKADTSIIVSEPYSLKYEWRLWMVRGKVVAASKYREYFRLTKEKGCPAEVIAFAEQRCKEYMPHEVFVMDVCQSGDQYYIVECGCMNGAGFYKADITAIVKSVSEYFSEKCEG
jgi:hypothetical protein